MSKAPKQAPASAQPLRFPVWLAFVSAGLCFVAAGYLGSTGGAWRQLYELRRIELPYVVKVVMSNPVALPVALIAAGAVVLGLTRVRVRSAALNESLSAVSGLVAVAAGLLACGFLYANVLAFEQVHRVLQQ